jgi:energy-coupling factor transporter transmembrane protein EcfT
MENERTFFADVQYRLENYVEDRVLLFKLQSTEKVAGFVPKLLLVFGVVFLSFFILMFLSILAAYFLWQLTGSFYWGVGIVTLVYIIALAILLFLYKKMLREKITNNILKMIFSNPNRQ